MERRKSVAREMTREELIHKIERLKNSLDSCTAELADTKAELADTKAELEKIRCQTNHINEVLYAVFGISCAIARNPEDLKSKCQRIVEERDKAVKQIEHDQVKISELINEIDCKRSEIMPDEPIMAADRLIHARGMRKTNAIQRAFMDAGQYESYNLYSVSDLREIAEHLLAYCKNNETEVDADD